MAATAAASIESFTLTQNIRKYFVPLAGLILLGFILRLLLASAFYGTYDQASYEIVASIMRRGGNIYAETTRYNYSPVWAQLLFAFDTVSRSTGTEFHYVVRAFLSVVDMLNGVLIALITETIYPGKGLRSGVAYWLNPAAILMVGHNGQFETLAVLPLLLALLLYLRRKGSPLLFWLLGTAALVVKHNTVFGVWMLFVYLFKPRRALLMMLAAAVVFLGTMLSYTPEGSEGIFYNVLRYAGLARRYGLGIILPPTLASIVMLLLLGILPFVVRKRLPVEQAMTFSFVLMLTVIYGFGEQYFLFLLLWSGYQLHDRFWFYLSAVFIACFPLSRILSHSVILSYIFLPLGPVLLWAVCAFWSLKYFRTNSKRPMHSRTGRSSY